MEDKEVIEFCVKNCADWYSLSEEEQDWLTKELKSFSEFLKKKQGK